ncbi:CPBP family intramembrane glutamic endopeptidase [Peribacillus sp. NPDC097197]
MWLLTIIFSITNAVLEELIWRGNLLNRFSELLGEKWAVVLTSLGFGLQHYSLGIPWVTCIAFSIGGMFYGGITIKGRSVIPSILWHFIFNILMVLSGFLLN